MFPSIHGILAGAKSPTSLIPGLVAFYAMDTGVGASVPDSYSNASDLIDTNAVQRTAGMDGNSVILDVPNNRYLTVSAANDAELSLLDFTVSFWLYVNTVPTGGTVYQFIYSKGGAWGGGFAAEIKYAAVGAPIAFLIYKGDNTSSVVHCTTRGPGVGWTFHCAYHNSTAKTFGIYSDSTGSLVDSSGSPGSYTWTPMTPPYSGGLNIGQQQNGATDGVLYLDNLAIFDRALTLEEITWLYNDGSGRTYNQIVV